ncbi:MAG: RdgB/HAM1 family non-canonical purine NTP pyrophosphatase [Alphaproteobacteria bacterium]|nr:RdgB/HAM1 family non-canonical purine NTP pyrophosphatase [Alphaproteobacteria bacterium]
MGRRFDASTLVIATHNPGKVREFDDLFRPLGVTLKSASALGLAEPEETGTTFRANAELKALAAAKASGQVALSDDSGLVVPALDGDPGIHSARWAGPTKDFAVAMQRVHDQLVARNVSSSRCRAHFVAALSLAWPDGHCETFQGEIHGQLVWPPRGERGFGYDPMFIPEGHAETFGEMDPAAKHAMSHRAHAFRQLIDGCFRSP